MSTLKVILGPLVARAPSSSTIVELAAGLAQASSSWVSPVMGYEPFPGQRGASLGNPNAELLSSDEPGCWVVGTLWELCASPPLPSPSLLDQEGRASLQHANKAGLHSLSTYDSRQAASATFSYPCLWFQVPHILECPQTFRGSRRVHQNLEHYKPQADSRLLVGLEKGSGWPLSLSQGFILSTQVLTPPQSQITRGHQIPQPRCITFS